MKILCISDNKDPLVYSANIKERFSDVDIVLSSGDLPLEYYGFIASSLNKPILFIFGNHYLKKLENFRRPYGLSITDPSKQFESYGAIYTGEKVLQVKGLLIAGLGGTVRYNNGQNQYTEMGMFFRILKLVPRLIRNRIRYGRFLDIFLTHTPPFGFNDEKDRCHTGFKIFLWFNRVFKPEYHIHGHIHLYDINAPRSTKYHNTIITNAYNHTVIDYFLPKLVRKGKVRK